MSGQDHISAFRWVYKHSRIQSGQSVGGVTRSESHRCSSLGALARASVGFMLKPRLLPVDNLFFEPHFGWSTPSCLVIQCHKMDIGKFRQKNPNPSIIWLIRSHLQGGQSSDTSAGPRWPHILSGKFLDDFFWFFGFMMIYEISMSERKWEISHSSPASGHSRPLCSVPTSCIG